METSLADSDNPEAWMFGATRKIHESSARPTVRISESISELNDA